MRAEGAPDPAASNIFARAGSWQALLGFGPDLQREIRKKLIKKCLLEEKKEGIPARIRFRVDSAAYLSFLSQQNHQFPEIRELDAGKPGNKPPESRELDTGKSGNYSIESSKKSLSTSAATAAERMVGGYLYEIKICNEDDEAILATISNCKKEEVELAQKRLGPRKGVYPSHILRELNKVATSLQPAAPRRQIGDKLTQGKWSGFEGRDYDKGINPDGSF